MWVPKNLSHGFGLRTLLCEVPAKDSFRAVPDGLSPMRCSREGNLSGPEESFDDLGPFSTPFIPDLVLIVWN